MCNPGCVYVRAHGLEFSAYSNNNYIGLMGCVAIIGLVVGFRVRLGFGSRDEFLGCLRSPCRVLQGIITIRQ